MTRKEFDLNRNWEKISQSPFLSFHNGHEYVDLGLSVKWATCNIGAFTPEGCGLYFAWGEVKPKIRYKWENYSFCSKGDTDDKKILSKYNDDSTRGLVDNKNVLEPIDDAAHANWGGKWRMPTLSEIEELIENCNWTKTTLKGMNGFMAESKIPGFSNRSIFLPAAEKHSWLLGFFKAESYGCYWSSSLLEHHPYTVTSLFLNFEYSFAKPYLRSIAREEGCTVRAVLS